VALGQRRGCCPRSERPLKELATRIQLPRKRCGASWEISPSEEIEPWFQRAECLVKSWREIRLWAAEKEQACPKPAQQYIRRLLSCQWASNFNRKAGCRLIAFENELISVAQNDLKFKKRKAKKPQIKTSRNNGSRNLNHALLFVRY
jgi:hypothetical protein